MLQMITIKETNRKKNRRLNETRCDMILDLLADQKMTARQIAYRLGFTDLNAVRPRLTEMKKDGRVRITGRTKDENTNKSVSIYEKVEHYRCRDTEKKYKS